MPRYLLKLFILTLSIQIAFIFAIANPEAERLKQHLDTHGPILVEDNILTVIYEGKASSVELCCSFQEPLVRLDDSDIWIFVKTVPNLSEAVLTYAFIVDGNFPQNEPGIWRGPQAPAAPEEKQPQLVRTLGKTFDSEILGESRDIYVYLPPNHESLKWGFDLPVVYVADQGTIGNQANYIEALIRQGKLPEMLLIAVEGGKGDEYISFENDGSFEQHERFLIEEILPWAETKYGAATEPKSRAIYGHLDGGIFAASIGIRNPDVFGNVIAFSLGVNPTFFDKTLSIDSNLLDSNFYFLAGELKQGAYLQTKELSEQLTQEGINSVFNSRVAGNDYLMWREAFIDGLLWTFGLEP